MTTGRWTFGAFFIAAGLLHLVRPGLFVAIVPPYIPWPLPLIYISGVAEIVLGGMLFVRRWSSPAGWGLLALLVAVFPANVHMAVNADQFPSIPETVLWWRLPGQGVLIALAYLFARDRDHSITSIRAR